MKSALSGFTFTLCAAFTRHHLCYQTRCSISRASNKCASACFSRPFQGAWQINSIASQPRARLGSPLSSIWAGALCRDVRMFRHNGLT